MSTPNYKIGFINPSYKRYFTEHKKEIMTAIEKCFIGGEFVLRDEVKKFEKNLADFVGTKYAVGVNSGTDALKLSYKALRLKKDDEVITVSHTFIAPIEEIIHLGGKPILIDVGVDALMDVKQIEKVITKKTVGIVPVHLSGKVCDMKEIIRIARKHKLWIVEDSAQALSAKQNKKMAGSFGDTGCFSFISPKTLGGAGDAGGIVTNDKKIYEKLLLLRNHWNITQNALLGHQPKAPRIMGWGYNSRLDNIQAAVLNVKFKYYSQLLKRRQEIAEKYLFHFQDLPLELPTRQDGQIWQEFIIQVKNISNFFKFMKQKGIELLIRDTIPNHKLRGLGLSYFKLPTTEIIANQCVRLPIYPELTNSEVLYIIDSIVKFYKYIDYGVKKKSIK